MAKTVYPPMHFPESWESFGPKMQACSDRERRFVWAYLMNSISVVGENPTQSARDAGYSDVKEGAKVQAHYLMHRPRVLEAMQEVALQQLRGLALPAVAAVKDILLKPDHPDRQKVALSVLSRLGMGEQSGFNLNVSGEVQINHTDRALEDLKNLLLLGVPREKLEETFGFSGLARYERMLAQREGRQLARPVVDVEATEVKNAD